MVNVESLEEPTLPGISIRGMKTKPDWYAELASLDESDWPAFLDQHSGLPGPRSNLELAVAAATSASESLIDELADSADEYRASCAAISLGRRADLPDIEPRARALSHDERWRVRMGVEIGLQLLGDRSLPVLQELALDWSRDPDPLVRRTAVAALCEPRLLRGGSAAAMAVRMCQTATASIVALPPALRREPGVRTLRQALGYCWSVAIAADPAPGLRAFRALDTADADIAWIVKQNLAKKRLSTLL